LAPCIYINLQGLLQHLGNKIKNQTPIQLEASILAATDHVFFDKTYAFLPEISTRHDMNSSPELLTIFPFSSINTDECCVCYLKCDEKNRHKRFLSCCHWVCCICLQQPPTNQCPICRSVISSQFLKWISLQTNNTI
jgi:hypothetical protein